MAFLSPDIDNPMLAELREIVGDDVVGGLERLVQERIGENRTSLTWNGLAAIGSAFGIRHVEAARIPFDGLLVPLSAGGYRVVVSSESSNCRRRFTLAHEISHAVLQDILPHTRKLATRSIFTVPGNRVEERLCDALAARLLMPSHDLKGLVLEFNGKSVLQLASRFQVSLAAAFIRMKEVLGVEAAMFTLHKKLRGDRCEVASVVGDFQIAPLRMKSGFLFDRSSMPSSAMSEQKDCDGWDWFRFGNVKRRLWARVDLACGMADRGVVFFFKNDHHLSGQQTCRQGLK